uniref:Small integral membrane protein 29 n=1 Tax=Amphiprion ocellaris TaxID=80972 RepID=A0AAQ5XDW5_AMPOC
MNKEMEHLNHTTHHISPPNNKPEFPGYYALIPFVLLTLTGCIVAAVCYIRRRVRLDELRHQLIPMYTYDPAEEQDDWGNCSSTGLYWILMYQHINIPSSYHVHMQQ